MHLLSSFRLSSTLAALLCLGACGDSGDTSGAGSSSGATEGASTTSASASSTTDVPTTTGESASTSGVSEGQSTSGDSTSAGTDPVTTSGPDTDPGSTGGGSTGNIDQCMPDPQDDPCTSCTKANCCDQATACQADQDCACVFECVGMGGDPMTCLGECMVDPFMNPVVLAAYMCVMGSCGADCGL